MDFIWRFRDLHVHVMILFRVHNAQSDWSKSDQSMKDGAGIICIQQDKKANYMETDIWSHKRTRISVTPLLRPRKLKETQRKILFKNRQLA